MRISLLVVLAVALFFAAGTARAACSGASLEQEYREADVVARGVVVAETRVTDDELSPDFMARWGDYSPVLLYRLRVIETFKGRPGPTINYLTEVTSGLFPVDVGGDYLVFFNYHQPSPRRGMAPRGAMYVRYACGQSKTWESVRAPDLRWLRSMRARR